jgi:hypothetical protein
MSDVFEKPLSQVFVFIDTHEKGICDAAFGIYQKDHLPYANTWLTSRPTGTSAAPTCRFWTATSNTGAGARPRSS